MFGKKQKPIQPVTSELSQTDNEVVTIDPYQDTPPTWEKLTEEELAQVWYCLALTHYDDTTSIPQPNDKGIQWYLDAANNDNPCAQYVLGNMYYKGVMTNINLVYAGMWYSRASANGNPFSDYEFAKMCAFGIGMETDKATAETLNQSAYAAFQTIERKKPNVAVEMILAVMCENNLIDQTDPGIAKHWRKLANSHTSTPIEISNSESPDFPIKLSQNQVEQKLDNHPNVNLNGLSAIATKSGIAEEVPVRYIFLASDNPYGKNDTDEELYALATSIQINGLIYPLTLNKISDNEYRIIAGEKRYKAITRYLHWDAIPSTVHEHLTENAAQLMLHTANLDVREYTSAQKLQFYIEADRLLHKMKESGEYTGPMQKGIAELLGISTHQIRKYKKIVEILSEGQLQRVMNGEVSIEKAYKFTLLPAGDQRMDVVEIPDTGRTSDLDDEPDAMENPVAGRTSAFNNEPDTMEEPVTGRTSDLDNQPDEMVEPVTERTSAFTDPTNFTESVALLESLSLAPGQKCSVITGSSKAEKGIINRIEIYQNALLVSVFIDNIRRPYPVSIIGIDLFIGNDSFEQATDAARSRV